MKKLSITILDFDDYKNPLLNGGQARATFEIGKRLVKKGHKVTIISSKYPGYKDRVDEGMKFKHIGFVTSKIRLNNLIYIFSLPFALLKVKADVVVECFTAPISTLFSPIFTKSPVVVVPSSFEAERFSKMYKLPFNLIEKFGLKLYKYALPYTQVVEAKMRKFNQKINTCIVPEGVGKDFFEIEKVKPKHILFIGRFDIAQKGIDLLLKSFAKVASESPLPLVLAGAGPDKEKIAKLIKKLKLEKKVSFLGATYGEEKMKLLSQAVAVAMPSRDETFSLFALEALASGNTFIKFDIPGLSWADPNVVYICKAFDTTAYGKLLLQVAKNTKEATKKGKQARKFASQFSWESVTDQYEKYFYQVLQMEVEKSKQALYLNNNNLQNLKG